MKQNSKTFIIIKNMLRELLLLNIFTHSGPILQAVCALNVYQINLYQHLTFMHQVSNAVAPVIFNDMFKKPSQEYPTHFPITIVA